MSTRTTALGVKAHRVRACISVGLVAAATLIRTSAVGDDQLSQYAFSTAVYGVQFLLLALIAYRWPHLLWPTIATPAAIAFTLAGLILGIATNYGAPPTMLLLSDALMGLGRMWAVVLACVGLAETGSGIRAMTLSMTGIASAYVALLCFASIIAAAPLPALGATIVLSLLIGASISTTPIRKIIDAGAIRSLDTTNPLSFVSLRSRFFVAVLLFEMIFGYQVSLGVGGDAALQTLAAGIGLVVILAFATGQRALLDADTILTLCLIAFELGIMLSMVSSLRHISSVILVIGSQSFYALIWSVLATIGNRNRYGLLVVIGWGFGLSTIGSAAGATLAAGVAALEAAGSEDVVALMQALFAFLTFAFAWLALRSFSFKKLFSEIAPVTTEPDGRTNAVDEETAPLSSRSLDSRIKTLAREGGLTPREQEIAFLLARGRNGSYIQERLVISRNTAKTHTRHIYQKLSVHSQQELIDLVESHD